MPVLTQVCSHFLLINTFSAYIRPKMCRRSDLVRQRYRALLVLVLASCIAVTWAQDGDVNDARGLPMKVDLHDADIRDVLTDIYKNRGSFVMDPKVHGRITGHFEGEQLDVAEEIVRRAHATERIEKGVSLLIATELPGAEGATEQASEQTIVFSFQNCDLTNALAAIMSVANDGHARSLQVDAAGHVDLSGRFASFDDSVRAVVDSEGATLCITNGNYRVIPSAAPIPDWWRTPVSLRFEKPTELREVLRTLFDNTGANYYVSPEIHTTTLACEMDGTLDNVLMRILGATQNHCSLEANVVHIFPEPGKPKPEPVVSDLQRMDLPARFHKVITSRHLVFVDAPYADVLAKLFARLPYRYHVRSIGNIGRATVDLSWMPLDNALKRFAEVSRSNIRYENDVVVIDFRGFIPPGIKAGSDFSGGGLIPRQDWSIGWVESGSSPRSP